MSCSSITSGLDSIFIGVMVSVCSCSSSADESSTELFLLSSNGDIGYSIGLIVSEGLTSLGLDSSYLGSDGLSISFGSSSVGLLNTSSLSSAAFSFSSN